MKNSKFFKAVGFVVIVLILSAAFTGCETESHDVSGQYAGMENPNTIVVAGGDNFDVGDCICKS